MADLHAIKDAAWVAYCKTPTARDCGRSKVDAAVDVALAVDAALTVGGMGQADFGMQSRSDAWERVAGVLDEVSPNWVVSRNGMSGVECAVDEIRALAKVAPPAAACVLEWTDQQCIEFACVAFRHAPKNLPNGVELNDIRMAAFRVMSAVANAMPTSIEVDIEQIGACMLDVRDGKAYMPMATVLDIVSKSRLKPASFEVVGYEVRGNARKPWLRCTEEVFHDHCNRVGGEHSRVIYSQACLYQQPVGEGGEPC